VDLRIRGGGAVPAGKVIGVVGNYALHRLEMGRAGVGPAAGQGAASEGPIPFFLKASSCLLPGGGDIVLPHGVGRVEHEVELAVVIGRTARRVAEADAMACVLGFAVFLDITARELQAKAKKEGMPWDEAKGFDTFGPISEVAPRAEVPDPHQVGLRLSVHGQVRQRGSTKQMQFQIPTLVARFSRAMTLERGDVIATGTPEGVGVLNPDDLVEAEAEGVGSLRCRVVAGPAP